MKSVPANARRILVMRLGAIGDCLRVLPAVARIRRERPDAEIGWAVEHWVLPALKGNPLVDRFHVLNRKADKAEALAGELGGPFVPGPIEACMSIAPRAGLLVNTTSVGMHDSRFEFLPIDLLPRQAIVTDIVYVPLLTPLLLDAQAIGLRTVDGLGMLLHQAVPGFEAWFGVRPEVTTDLRAKIEATL